MITVPEKVEGDLLYASEINEIVDFINSSTLHKYARINPLTSGPSVPVLDDITGLAKDSGLVLVEYSEESQKKLINYDARINGYHMGLVLGMDYAGITNEDNLSDSRIVLKNTGKIEIDTGYSTWGIDIKTEGFLLINSVGGITMNSADTISVNATTSITFDTSDIVMVTPSIQMPNIPGFMPGTSDPSIVTRLLFLEPDGKLATLPADQIQAVINYNTP